MRTCARSAEPESARLPLGRAPNASCGSMKVRLAKVLRSPVGHAKPKADQRAARTRRRGVGQQVAQGVLVALRVMGSEPTVRGPLDQLPSRAQSQDARCGGDAY